MAPLRRVVVMSPPRGEEGVMTRAMTGRSAAAPIALEVAKCRWPSRVHRTPFPAVVARRLADTVSPAVSAPFPCGAKPGGSPGS